MTDRSGVAKLRPRARLIGLIGEDLYPGGLQFHGKSDHHLQYLRVGEAAHEADGGEARGHRVGTLTRSPAPAKGLHDVMELSA